MPPAISHALLTPPNASPQREASAGRGRAGSGRIEPVARSARPWAASRYNLGSPVIPAEDIFRKLAATLEIVAKEEPFASQEREAKEGR